MLRTMSSTKPLVFINNPSVNDSLAGALHNIATRKVPMILPPHAAVITSTKSPHASAPHILATSVFKPLEAKYNGSNSPDTKSSILRINLSEKSLPFGIVNPNTNAPNMECIPIRSVINPDTITPASVKQTYASSRASCSGEHLRATHFIAGLKTYEKQFALFKLH
nr:hypothetical protein EUGRSUZ_B02181 [Ipomoea trifida]